MLHEYNTAEAAPAGSRAAANQSNTSTSGISLPAVQPLQKVSRETPATVQLQLNNTGLPDNLKSGIEHLSGISMNDVRVHNNSAQPKQMKWEVPGGPAAEFATSNGHSTAGEVVQRQWNEVQAPNGDQVYEAVFGARRAVYNATTQRLTFGNNTVAAATLKAASLWLIRALGGNPNPGVQVSHVTQQLRGLDAQGKGNLLTNNAGTRHEVFMSGQNPANVGVADLNANEGVFSLGANTCVIVFLHTITQGGRPLVAGMHFSTTEMSTTAVATQHVATMRLQLIARAGQDVLGPISAYCIGGVNFENDEDGLLEYAFLLYAIRALQMTIAIAGIPTNVEADETAVDAGFSAAGLRWGKFHGGSDSEESD